ncbi:unnamed protein product [Echinostoma caproni]|uniref:MMS19 nucleotide excision repair protein n=1 Tax=Echinostoma caproni TaxID=27848 RepID=A0A3P8KCK9_9TREM|nr:unnamed protein product [Echinostoma caproni]
MHASVLDRADLLLCLFTKNDSLSSLELRRLGDVIRITTAVCSEDQQNQLLLSYDYPKTEANGSKVMMILSWCSILSGLRSKVVQSVGHLRSIEWLCTTCQMIQGLSQDGITQSILSVLCIAAAEAFASVLNKAPEPLDTATLTAVDTVARCLSDRSADDHLLVLQPWLGLFSLRAFIANPGSTRWVHTQSLVTFMVPTNVSEAVALQVISNDGLEHHILALIEAPQPGSVFSEECHWQSTSLVAQKTFCLMDAYLSMWLKLCASIPEQAILTEMQTAIRFSSYAVISSNSACAQNNGLSLLCVLADIAGSKAGNLWKALSPGDVDDLFAALPRVVEKNDSGYVNACEILLIGGTCVFAFQCPLQKLRTNADTRIAVARCLHCLHKLPPEITTRHQDVEVMPLLAKLIDDPNRAVRFAAVHTQNEWLL